jgi:hypothetical protein
MENVVKATQILACERGWDDVLQVYNGTLTQQQFISQWVDDSSRWYNEQLFEDEYATGVFDDAWIQAKRQECIQGALALVPYKTTGLTDAEIALLDPFFLGKCREVFYDIHEAFCPDIPNDLLDVKFEVWEYPNA